ncbi:RNA polymerase-binding transcription factor DksA [Cupriavidus laharis]|uniref:RNA polymerase-binding transcription factor DksA n=1 Tax=Cupriavidus laharis TaxID=151654 RepID=A0ABM8WFC2_9BURK|nr:TraR/DksA C4-type zinc finger protein [Cupriavidus laharis]CAG9166026.1 RNA polymerase-binding transcription factor DksA [Cupriavidus laharis]
MHALTKQEQAALAAQLDADEARVRAAVGSADSPLAPMGQAEARDEADLAEEEVIHRQDDAMLEHYRMELADIEAARARMKAGQYGICTDCGQAIPYSRLQAYPTAKRCTACQSRHEHLYARDQGGAPGSGRRG